MKYTRKQLIELLNCAENPIYFAEKYVNITTLNGKHLIKLTDAQKKTLTKLASNKMTVVCGARQVGKGSIGIIFAMWKSLFVPKSNIEFYSTGQMNSTSMCQIFESIYAELPEFITDRVVKPSRNELSLINGSKISFKSITDSIDGKYTFSGKTILFDEAAFMNEKALGRFIKQNNESIYDSDQVVMMSTPYKASGFFYDIWNNKLDKSWKRVKITWNSMPGRDLKWKQKVIKAIGKSSWKQEFGNEFLTK